MGKDTVISNIEIYNTRMDASIEDKLWFLNQNIDADVYVDFGCANGNLLKEMYQRDPGKVYIGYDNNPDMLCLARKHCLGTSIIFGHFFNKIKEYIDKKYPGRKICLIMSSVLHEVYFYSKNAKEIEEFWRVIRRDLSPDYIAIRDMDFGYDSDRINERGYTSSEFLSIRNELFREIRLKADKKQLKDFENIYGLIDSYKNLTHFLLKYKYVENWDREVKENYFSYTVSQIMSELQWEYSIKYKKDYCLPYLYTQFKKDFGIDFMGYTHYNLLLRKFSND